MQNIVSMAVGFTVFNGRQGFPLFSPVSSFYFTTDSVIQLKPMTTSHQSTNHLQRFVCTLYSQHGNAPVFPSPLPRSLETREADERYSWRDSQGSDVLEKDSGKTKCTDAYFNQRGHDDRPLDLTGQREHLSPHLKHYSIFSPVLKCNQNAFVVPPDKKKK